LGLGHSHPTPTLPSHADIRVVQSVPGLHISVLHKEHVHDVRASWGVDDIRVEFETDEITITSFDPLILELPNYRFYFHELPTLCKALSRISVGAIPSDIKSTLGSGVQQERYLTIMLHFRLIEKTSWSGRPRNLSGRKPTCQYALTKKGQRLLALVNKFNRDLKSLLKEELI